MRLMVGQNRIRPLQIGKLVVPVPLLLAPMEDVTNLAFRLVCKQVANPGLMFTEFVSAMAVHYNPDRTVHKMRVDPAERPLGIQIFGGEPDKMAAAARLAEEMGADLVDINMGCWVPKVCRTGAGAALLKDPETAEKIVRSVVNAVSIPVTVKVRAGFEYGLFAAPELALRFQDAGAQMLTLHARFAKQGFDGKADWGLISSLKRKLQIPVIGNGDVKTPADALGMLNETGCDGVMVGRAAISNPWALARIRAGMVGDPEPVQPTLPDRVAVAVQHTKLMVAHQCDCDTYEQALQTPDFAEQEPRAVRALRGQLPLYIKGVHGAAQIRSQLSTVSTVDELERILSLLDDSCADSEN